MKQMDEISKYLCLLLRHQHDKAELDMDVHGWVASYFKPTVMDRIDFIREYIEPFVCKLI